MDIISGRVVIILRAILVISIEIMCIVFVFTAHSFSRFDAVAVSSSHNHCVEMSDVRCLFWVSVVGSRVPDGP